MKTIVMINNKGGVGKTNSVTAISHILSQRLNKRVLMVDLDPQMNMTSMFCDVDFIDLFSNLYNGSMEKGAPSVEDLLMDSGMDVNDCILHTKYAGLDMIPAFLTLSEAEERLKADVRTPQQFRLRYHLDKLKDQYDFCIIDTSPSVSILNINGLAAAQEVFVPLRCDGGSLLGATITKNLIETVRTYNPGLRMGGMFFTQWNGRKNVSKTVYELMETAFGETLLPYTIRVSKDVEESTLAQVPILDYAPRAAVTGDYIALADYIAATDKAACRDAYVHSKA